MKKNNRILASIVISTICISTPSTSNAEWSIESLGMGVAEKINNSGQVLIDSQAGATIVTGDNGHGVTKTYYSGGYTSSSATSINDLGQITGYSRSYGDVVTSAFITGPNGVGTTYFGSANRFIFPSAINNSGRVAGSSSYDNSHSFSFVTGDNGVGITSLDTFGSEISYLSDINNSGQAIGNYYDQVNVRWRGFIYNPDGTMQDIGTLGGDYIEARVINDIGQIAGSSSTSTGDYFSQHAFITNPGSTTMIDLGAMNGNRSGVSGINNHGQVVGLAGFNEDYGRSSFIYSNGVMVNLSMLDAVVAAGWTEILVNDINDNGQIVGTGVLNNTWQAFLLSGADDANFFNTYDPVPFRHLTYNDVFPPIPEPQTYAMLLAGLAFFGFSSGRRLINKQI